MTLDIDFPEIRACLSQGQIPYDHPDLLCRVFEAKKVDLIHEIVKNEILGPVLANVAVIEFQKWGAHHIHILFWIKDFESTPENIDNIISAEIPPRGKPGTEE